MTPWTLVFLVVLGLWVIALAAFIIIAVRESRKRGKDDVLAKKF